MTDKIVTLLKEYKAKNIEEDRDSVDTVEFTIKQITAVIQIEEDECQYWIKEVQGVDLPEEYFENIIEYGDYDSFESFIVAIKDGEYNYIKYLYTSLNKLNEKYEDEFGTMIQYFR